MDWNKVKTIILNPQDLYPATTALIASGDVEFVAWPSPEGPAAPKRFQAGVLMIGKVWHLRQEVDVFVDPAVEEGSATCIGNVEMAWR